MFYINKIPVFFSYSLLYAMLIKVVSLFKVSYIFGSYCALFSASSCATPLAGAFLGMPGSFAVCGLGLGLRLLFWGSFSLRFLAYYIPSFFASLYWSTQSLLIRLLVPVVCMVLFMIHPVGSQAFVYSFYWFIPMGLYFVKNKSLFTDALASTFIAHSVGSVIWLYTTPMTPAAWLGLIPVVAAERLVFASGMVVIYKVIDTIKNNMGKKYATTFSLYHGWQ